eukprot:TRINITY_DN62910_c0_g1_i1.p1 TRINITY_DN62910_c0_g1~~TRINITY_DN62910_c0_g1_i1.p1  ORF type:complete len:158 (+),score=66.28 TRINITY_DN62910_c0_g1_i1:67-540(+)
MAWDDSDESEEEQQQKKPASKAKAAPKKDATASSAPAAPAQKIVSKDSLEELELNLQKDVDQLVKMLVPKLKEASAKKAVNKFLSDSLAGMQLKMSLQETESLHKTCKELMVKRKAEEAKREKDEAAKKVAEEEAAKRAKQEAEGQMADEDFFKDFM